MTDKTWTVDVQVSTVVRKTLPFTIVASSRAAAEADAAAQVRQLEHDELPPGYQTIRWMVDHAVAREAEK